MERFTELTYDELRPGPVGSFGYTLTDDAVGRWRRLVEDDEAGGVPMSYALTWFLEALREGLRGIPAGGVLARHELRFGRQPSGRGVLWTEMTVHDRYEKRGRDYAAFRFTTTEDGVHVADDVMHLIWPRHDGETSVQARSGPPPAPPSVRGDLVLEGRISQAQIDAYAELSGDYNPLHCDPAAGRASPFGSTIAHGPIPLGYVLRGLGRLRGADWVEGLAVDARFVAPSRPGDHLRVVRVEPDQVVAVRQDDRVAVTASLVGAP